MKFSSLFKDFNRFLNSLLFKLIIASLIVAASVFIFIKRASEKNPLQNSTLGEVKRQNLSQRVTISGQVWPRKRLDIRPPFNGYIMKLYVKVGDHVHFHDPLVTFSPSLSAGETNFPIRAGFAGVVTQLLKSEGEYISETGDQNLVLRVEDLSELSILGSVPELDIAKLKLGQEALIRVSSLVGESFSGQIIEIGLSAKAKDSYSSASSEFQIKVSLNSHDPRLFPGMSAIMDVVTDKRENVLTLAHEFIQEDEMGYFVIPEKSTKGSQWAKNENAQTGEQGGAGEKKRIKLGLQTDEAAEVLSGLSAGEKVRPIDFLNLPALKN